MIRNLEELALNAWPALQTVACDGWLLRFAEGYTRRANSVNPLYPSMLDLDEKVAWCEQFYSERGLPVVFKLTDAAQPPGLDARLANKGYVLDAPTAVQTLVLSHRQDPSMASEPALPILVRDALTDAWLDAFCAMSGISERNHAVLVRLLANIVPAHGYASVPDGGRIVACGLGVVQAGALGLFDLVTDPERRRRGFGRRVVEGLLAWGKERGATLAYLQVMRQNTPALRLYAALGFAERYGYWYRVKTQQGAARSGHMI